MQSGPYFYLPISPIQYAKAGFYKLTLQGNCGGMDCPPCIINFNVDCPNPCPCDVPQFQKDVAQGFATTLWTTSCKACFSPIALNDCDMVEWKINGGSVAGMTNGNQSFCQTFAVAGMYIVTMIVSRKKSDGSACETFVFSKSVTVTCFSWPDCSTSLIANPRFSEGTPIPGGLNSGGVSEGWQALSGDPKVIEGQPAGTLDGWAMYLTGNLDSADVLSSEVPICVKDSGMVTIRMATDPIPGVDVKLGRKPPGGGIAIVFYQGNTLNIRNCDNCYRLASIEGLLPLDSGEWVQIQFPYNISDWAAMDPCGDGDGGIPVRIAVYVTSPLGNNQGGFENGYRAELDNICVEGQLVGIKDLLFVNKLRIYPNPNPGTFSVELPEAAKSGMRFRITDLAGRLVQEQATEQGGKQQTVQAGLLPNGLYFLQVVAEGKVLAVEKFVKQ